MDRKIIITEDNSKTLLIPSMNETYHSTHGAINEALHVFVASGLACFDQAEINVFEMGFGTGLNALVALNHAQENNIRINFTTIEKHPLPDTIAAEMGYPQQMDALHLSETYSTLHTVSWEQQTQITPLFSLKKIAGSVETVQLDNACHDIVFYDAFGPRVQPDLWSETVLRKMFAILKPGGILVTYCAQGQFKRNLKAAGFEVENLPGPPGKREMTRGIKPCEGC